MKQCEVAFTFLLSFFILIMYSYSQSEDPYVQNLDEKCLRCLCIAATDCDLSLGCISGYCGPYKVSKVYWTDTGNVTLPTDVPERAGAFEDCAFSYNCAQRMVIRYMAKYAKDCNGDGVTNCDDYVMINFNGGWKCQPPLTNSEIGRNWTERYRGCAPTEV